MFEYESADVTYAVIFGKLDSSSNIDYSFDLNKREAKSYTKARMLGQDLNEVMDTSRIEREIIRYEKDEYGTDIRNARIIIRFCDNQEQPLVADVKEYLKDLLAAHRISFAREVVEAQLNVFEDTENDWNQIALDLAMEVDCPGYAKKFQGGKFNQDDWEIEREKYLKLHPEISQDDKPKCGETVRRYKKEFIREYYKKSYWFVRWEGMSYSSKEDKIKRLRGCQLIEPTYNSPPYILTNSGKKVKINTSGFFEPYFYGIGLCPYNAEPEAFSVRNMPDGGAYYNSRKLAAGKWGFIDTEGNVVIEPQYVYALGAFGPADKEYFVVARLVNKKTLWGILDYNGNESVPCQYASIEDISCFWNNVFPTPIDIVIYQEDVDGLFGLMKIDGTVILPPMFGHIGSCYFGSKYNFIKAGKDVDYDGVFSLEKNKYVIPPFENSLSYDTKFYDETKTIKLIRTRDSKEICYDYDGNLIK